MTDLIKNYIIYDNQFNDLDSYVAYRITMTIEEIQNYVSELDDTSLFNKSELSGCQLDNNEFLLEWTNGWGRVQFHFSENYDEIIYMDNRDKESTPKLVYTSFDMTELSDIVDSAAKFVASFS